jgi:integrase
MSSLPSRPSSSQTSTTGPTTNLAYLKRDKNQYGAERIFVRRNGKTIRLRETPGTAAFAKEYADALQRLASGIAKRKEAEGRRPKIRAVHDRTFGWLAKRYFASQEFQGLDPKSQRTRRIVIEECLHETHKGVPMADCPIEHITSAKIKALRDAKGELRGAGNNRRKYLSAMFGWAVEADLMTGNPARDVKKLKYATDGFHTWTIDEVRRYEERHSVGTKARLALALLLYLGVRRCDVVRLGPGMISDCSITFVPKKTDWKSREPLTLPILPELAEVLAASQIGTETFLETEWGKPFSDAGFGGWFRKRCDEAGLPECSAHGLRKAGATLAAERGATAHQLMAIFGWDTVSMADRYTRRANRKKLAGEAMKLLARNDGQVENNGT